MDRIGKPIIVFGYDEEGLLAYDVLEKKVVKMSYGKLRFALLNATSDILLGL